MKKVLTFIGLILIISACESTPPNPLYLDTNGVTVKAHKWAKIGDEGIINDVRYTIVDKETLKNLIRSGNSYDRVCTSFIADMSNLFDRKNTSQDISNWDVSNVQNMNYMFARNYGFNSDISNWDVSNVISMDSMFWVSSSFNQDLSSWDVSNVQNMNSMFRSASSFNQDLSSWDVNKVVFFLYSIRDFSDGTTNWTLPKPNF
jgi:surface protein